MFGSLVSSNAVVGENSKIIVGDSSHSFGFITKELSELFISFVACHCMCLVTLILTFYITLNSC